MGIEERQFRNALGRFATGVCVVSSRGVDGFPIGMTINSFSSVSLNPSLVQWSICRRANTYALFANQDIYAISFLSERQQDVSMRYARPGDHRMPHGDYLISPSGLPFVRGALAHFECARWHSYEVGDHDIVVGIVEQFYSGQHEESPLVYYQGSYRSLIAS